MGKGAHGGNPRMTKHGEYGVAWMKKALPNGKRHKR